MSTPYFTFSLCIIGHWVYNLFLHTFSSRMYGYEALHHVFICSFSFTIIFVMLIYFLIDKRLIIFISLSLFRLSLSLVLLIWKYTIILHKKFILFHVLFNKFDIFSRYPSFRCQSFKTFFRYWSSETIAWVVCELGRNSTKRTIFHVPHFRVGFRPYLLALE